MASSLDKEGTSSRLTKYKLKAQLSPTVPIYLLSRGDMERDDMPSVPFNKGLGFSTPYSLLQKKKKKNENEKKGKKIFIILLS